MVGIVGADDGEGTPVPIPNTEVKLTGVDDTRLEAARDNRKVPTQINSSCRRMGSFFAAVSVRRPAVHGRTRRFTAGQTVHGRAETAALPRRPFCCAPAAGSGTQLCFAGWCFGRQCFAGQCPVRQSGGAGFYMKPGCCCRAVGQRLFAFVLDLLEQREIVENRR